MDEEGILNPEKIGMTLNESMKSDLLCIAKWVQRLYIISGIYAAFLVPLFTLWLMNPIFIWGIKSRYMTGWGWCSGLIILISLALSLFCISKASQFAKATEKAGVSNNEGDYIQCFAKMRSLIFFLAILSFVDFVWAIWNNVQEYVLLASLKNFLS